ncbi:MAG: SDR family oxidoreductase [Pseudomonadota bacterium]|nr:SDR family oxidoreductase [Pseudomonadota bacterium]
MTNTTPDKAPALGRRPEFPDGVALVIGGSGGIGSAICSALARAGTDVALTYRNNQAAALQVVEAVTAQGRGANCYPLSLENSADVDRVVSQIIAEHSRIHTVINAAGTTIPMTYIGDLAAEKWREVMHLDADGFFNLVKGTLPHLRKLGGSYVQIGTVALTRWATRDVLSAAPKAAIDALMTGIAREEGRSGVRANTVALGLINAGMALRFKGNEYDEGYFKAASRNTALKRLGTAEEVADSVVFFGSNRATYLTGQTLLLDGGYSL